MRRLLLVQGSWAFPSAAAEASSRSLQQESRDPAATSCPTPAAASRISWRFGQNCWDVQIKVSLEAADAGGASQHRPGSGFHLKCKMKGTVLLMKIPQKVYLQTLQLQTGSSWVKLHPADALGHIREGTWAHWGLGSDSAPAGGGVQSCGSFWLGQNTSRSKSVQEERH